MKYFILVNECEDAEDNMNLVDNIENYLMNQLGIGSDDISDINTLHNVERSKYPKKADFVITTEGSSNPLFNDDESSSIIYLATKPVIKNLCALDVLKK